MILRELKFLLYLFEYLIKFICCLSRAECGSFYHLYLVYLADERWITCIVLKKIKVDEIPGPDSSKAKAIPQRGKIPHRWTQIRPIKDWVAFDIRLCDNNKKNQ